MNRIGIVVLCTNAYFVLGVRFVKRFMHFYKGDSDIIFYMFTDTNPKDYLPDDIHYEYIHLKNKSWVDGTNSKFTSIISLEDRDVDYLFYFDADTNVNQPFTEEWFLGDMVGGQHYGDQGWMKEKKGFDRNPRSKAYVPFDTTLPQTYFYGAFFGGNKKNMVEFCKLMRSYQLADKEWGYEPGVNDESYINREFHFNRPSRVVPCTEFKFAISDKGGIGETRDMRLNVGEILKSLKENKYDHINISGGKVIVDDTTNIFSGIVNGIALKFQDLKTSGTAACVFTGLQRDDYGLETIFLTENDTVIDVGANIGMFSIYVKKKFNCKVIAFEPVVSNYRNFLKNIELNGLNISDFEIHNTAITSVDDSTVDIGTPIDNTGGSSVFVKSNVRPCKTETLGKYIVPGCTYLKIDCEGGEYEIIPSVLDKLNVLKYIGIEYHRFNASHNPAEQHKLIEDNFNGIIFTEKRMIDEIRKSHEI